MFAIVDLETTGGKSREDRITEVAVILHDGQQRVREYSTLINPGVPIPFYITGITGIDDDMVVDAPAFSEIAGELFALLSGPIFVAHNVNFDFHFLQQAYLREGYQFNPPLLCTVRTSRKLMPGLRSYSLV